MKRKRQLQQKQDELRRANQAYKELASVGGYLDHANKLLSLQYLVVTMVDVLGAELEATLERANLKTTKTISIQNALRNATDSYYKHFEGAMSRDSVMNWSQDLEALEQELYNFANIKPLRPKRKAMAEAKAVIEERYNITLEDLK